VEEGLDDCGFTELLLGLLCVVGFLLVYWYYELHPEWHVFRCIRIPPAACDFLK